MREVELSNLYLNSFVQQGQRIVFWHFYLILIIFLFSSLSQRIKRKCSNFQLHTKASCTNTAENIRKHKHFPQRNGVK